MSIEINANLLPNEINPCASGKCAQCDGSGIAYTSYYDDILGTYLERPRKCWCIRHKGREQWINGMRYCEHCGDMYK